MGLLLVHVRVVHGKELPAEDDLFSAIHVGIHGLLPPVQHRLRNGAQAGSQHPGNDPVSQHIRSAQQRQLLQNLSGEKHRHIGQNRFNDGVKGDRREEAAVDPVQLPGRAEMDGQGVS